MATQAINQWFIDDIRMEQAAKDADLATRIIEAFAGQPVVNMSPSERCAYDAALRTMTTYLTHEVFAK